MTETVFRTHLFEVNIFWSHLLTRRGRGFRLTLQPAKSWQMRCFGFTFGLAERVGFKIISEIAAPVSFFSYTIGINQNWCVRVCETFKSSQR